ncbi:MAG: tetratricopeptide repeat protein [Candidatus Obscuribacterales bacterium]|nr:tetratricopeptide repeat protein [Candidatus Obscuribacterales bacterium]
MSKSLALICALAVLELGLCVPASMSENSSSSDMPANTESISETAEAEQPAKLIEESAGVAKRIDGAPPLKESHAEAVSTKASRSAKSSEEDEEADEKKDMEDDKERNANAFMSQDDSKPGANLDPVLYYEAGCRYIRQKKYQLALDAFSKALELNPRYYEASYKKGLVYQLTGYDKYAARRYQDVLKYRPDMLEARINLAALHRKHKHYSGAEEELREVIHYNFFSFEGHYNLANVLVEANKPDEALKEYKICLKMKPNNPMVHNNMGVLFLQKNYPIEALQEFRKANQLSPKNPTFVSNVNTTQKLIAEKKAKGLTM